MILRKDLGFEIRVPEQRQAIEYPVHHYHYQLQMPQRSNQGQVQLTNLESCVDRWDLPRKCQCEGACNCQHKEDKERNAIRYRRSTTEGEVKVAAEKPKKSKSQKSFKSTSTRDFEDALMGDSYILERVRNKRSADAPNGLVGISLPSIQLPEMNFPQIDLDSINSQIVKNVEALKNFQL